MQLTGTQQRAAEWLSLATDVIYYGLIHNNQAKPFPRESTIKEADKENPDILGDAREGSACSSHCTCAVMSCTGYAHKQKRWLCLKTLKSAPCEPHHELGRGGVCCDQDARILLLAMNACCQQALPLLQTLRINYLPVVLDEFEGFFLLFFPALLHILPFG